VGIVLSLGSLVVVEFSSRALRTTKRLNYETIQPNQVV
jgi:hypothetical protein